MTMRVKLETLPPLPPLKAWFSTGALSTILDLKTALCADLQPLSHVRARAEDIVLLLDDFELLNTSPLDVIRDGDLIVYVPSSLPPTSLQCHLS